MTETELGAILRRMYQTAPKGERTTAIELFGIRYVAELADPGISVNRVATMAGISKMNPCIRNGMRLARYVDLNDRIAVYGLRPAQKSNP